MIFLKKDRNVYRIRHGYEYVIYSVPSKHLPLGVLKECIKYARQTSVYRSSTCLIYILACDYLQSNNLHSLREKGRLHLQVDILPKLP